MAEIDERSSYMMPAHFGGRPGGMPAETYHETFGVTSFYETDADALARLLPPGFQLVRPEVMVSVMENRGTDWMGGEPYNLVAVNAAARFEGERDRIEGWFSLVVWEDKATPILPGREQTGIPKIYGQVESIRISGDGREARSWAHYGGHSFFDLHVTSIREIEAGERARVVEEFQAMPWLAYRYIPRPGPEGGASLREAILFPQEFQVVRARVGSSELVWTPPPLHKNPTQAHIIATLAALPVGAATRPCILTNGPAILRGDQARVLR